MASAHALLCVSHAADAAMLGAGLIDEVDVKDSIFVENGNERGRRML